MLDKLGYDKALYSTKSRVFVVSFQCDSKIQVTINDAILGEMHRRVWDLYLQHFLDTRGLKDDHEKTSRYIFFKVPHEKCYGCSYGLANLSNSYLRVKLDMTDSENCCYTPTDGTSEVIVKPRSLKYIGSSISDPEAQEVSLSRAFEVEDIDSDEARELEGDNQENEGEGSEEEDDEDE